jgi:hypothetical protein
VVNRNLSPQTSSSANCGESVTSLRREIGAARFPSTALPRSARFPKKIVLTVQCSGFAAFGHPAAKARSHRLARSRSCGARWLGVMAPTCLAPLGALRRAEPADALLQQTGPCAGPALARLWAREAVSKREIATVNDAAASRVKGHAQGARHGPDASSLQRMVPSRLLHADAPRERYWNQSTAC